MPRPSSKNNLSRQSGFPDHEGMFMNAPMPCQSLDEQGDFLDVNQKFLEVLGYSREEIIGRNFSEILHPDWVDHFKENFPRFKAVGEVMGVEFEMVKKDGSTILVFFNGKVQRDHQGGFLCTYCIFQDITEQKRLERRLKTALKEAGEGKQTLEALMEHIPMGITIADKDTRLRRVSRHGLEMMGWAEERHLGLSVEQIISEWDVYLADGVTRARVEQLPLSRAIMKGETVFGQEIVQRHADGRAIPLCCDAGPIRDSRGRVVGGIVAWQDITERKQALEALRESEAFIKATLDNLPVGVSINSVDPKVQFTYMNNNFIKFYRTTGEQLSPPNDFWEVVYQDPKFREKIKNRVLDDCASGDPERMYWEDIPITRPGQETFYVTAKNIPLPESNLMVSTVWDVTGRKKTEQEREKLQAQLLQAQKMESVGLMAGGMAHDFNNLLHAMGGNLELLLKGKPHDHPDVRRLAAIEKSLNRSARLIRQLLTFSRKTVPSRQLLDLDQEIVSAARVLERTIPKMVRIELYPGKDVHKVNADPVQLEQILLNLGLNAADAMPEGGRLIIETRNIDLDEEFLRTHPRIKTGPYVLLTVSDTGSGMDRDTLERVFEPFFTTKEVGKGTGLGLATAYGIVKAHDGHITCYSEIGQGTTFRIYLPAARRDQAEHAEKEQHGSVPGEGTETILVVDDDAEIRDLTGEFLEDSGYKVLSAASGELALEIFKEMVDGVDLVLMDLNMPGMGGRKCAQEMISADPSVKVLVASGYSANGHGGEASGFGAKGFLSKPYQMKELLVRIREVLDGD